MIGSSRHVTHCQDGVAGESGWEKCAPYVFLSNGDDEYYWQGFETREELEAFIAQLREAGDKAFGPTEPASDTPALAALQACGAPAAPIDTRGLIP